MKVEYGKWIRRVLLWALALGFIWFWMNADS